MSTSLLFSFLGILLSGESLSKSVEATFHFSAGVRPRPLAGFHTNSIFKRRPNAIHSKEYSLQNHEQGDTSTYLLMSKSNTPSFSCIATVSNKNSDGTIIEITKVEKGEVSMVHNQTYGLSSPREWMECIEGSEGMHGAYTVLRCDIQTTSTRSGQQHQNQEGKGKYEAEIGIGVDGDCKYEGLTNKNTVDRIWGESFHLERLRASYESMFLKTDSNTYSDESLFSLAQEQSKNMLQSILNFAIEDLKPMSNEKERKVLMVTILWQPQPQASSNTPTLPKENANGILVRAHAFSTDTPSLPKSYNPEPITAAVKSSLPDGKTSNQYPNRYDNNPEAKSSNWCRIRRPIEDQLKTSGVGEVLLTMPCETSSKDLELLEGLTSNLFVVYTDGTTRTAGKNILEGYARHLVLEAAERNGLTISYDEPILLSDARKGLWSEVFVTSSIRLIIPVSKVILPALCRKGDDDSEGGVDDTRHESWSELPLESLPWDTRRWKILYDAIICDL